MATTPTISGTIDQRFFIEPLLGAESSQSYLDRFPDALYNKSIDSRLVKFLYALLGPAGIGWLRANYLQARLITEDLGLDFFDLDAFFGNPLAFGRIIEEIYDEDPNGLLPLDKWEEIRAKDAKYRNRAIDYINGAKAGNTPEGIRLVARAGLGHEVEVIENYKHLYDAHSDQPISLPYFGKTLSTEEFIVLPRREIPQGEVQAIIITGAPSSGTFKLAYNWAEDRPDNITEEIAYNATRFTIQMFLESIPEIGPGQVDVSGGPLPDNPIEVRFTGQLANRDVNKLYAIDADFITSDIGIRVEVKRNGVDATEEIVYISDRDKHYLDSALSRIRPVASLVSYQEASGIRTRQNWQTALSSSRYHDVVRFVTGNANVLWPARDRNINWIESGIEHKSTKSARNLQYHYTGYQNIISVDSYTEEALDDPDYLTDNWINIKSNYPNNHNGNYTNYQQTLFPYLANISEEVFADMIKADYHEPLLVTSQLDRGTETNVSLVNNIYSTSLSNLPGVPPIQYTNEQFWSSKERPIGDDYIEIDLGSPKAVNFLSFEISNKPIAVEIDYDVLDSFPRRRFVPITPDPDVSSSLEFGFDATSLNPWTPASIFFSNSLGDIIFTRFIRLRFTRVQSINNPFVTPDGTLLDSSVEVKNLRIGRSLS